MVGITLSAEQIRTAPPEVRRWLEKQLALTLGLNAPEPPMAHPGRPHLVACSIEHAFQVYSLIQGMLPVVNVFFELGRESASVATKGIEAFSLIDIMRHARMGRPEHVVSCLDVINDAVRRVCGDENATFYGLDNRGYCFVAEQTQRSILRLWKHVTGESALDAAKVGTIGLGGTNASGSGSSDIMAPTTRLPNGFVSPSFLTASAVPADAANATDPCEPGLAAAAAMRE